MQDYKKRIEAMLFTTGKFLTPQELSKLCSIGNLEYLRKSLEELKEKYNNQESALEIINEDDKWKLSIKKDYLHLTEKLLTTAELDLPTQETLAVIAYKQPSIQNDVIKIRGNKAYDHVKNLVEQNFITSEKFGRTRILKLTQKFYDYFDVIDKNLKEIFKQKENKDEI